MKTTRPDAVVQLEPGVRRVLAGNASPMTYWGTNTYIVGTGNVAVIDPGPLNEAHQATILNALSPGEQISHIFVTHAHVDHSPLASHLANAVDAPVFAFGDAKAGRSEIMQELAGGWTSGGGEGVDHDFSPDQLIKDGETVHGKSWALTAHWTPGHFCNHMCFEFGDAVFTGDHIMDWASSLVSPPDGDLTDFMASTRRLEALDARIFYPGHGNPVDNPKERARWLLDHRYGREAEILSALTKGAATARQLCRGIYHDTDPALLPAAERNVFAHLIDLTQSGRITPQGVLSLNSSFALTD